MRKNKLQQIFINLQILLLTETKIHTNQTYPHLIKINLFKFRKCN